MNVLQTEKHITKLLKSTIIDFYDKNNCEIVLSKAMLSTSIERSFLHSTISKVLSDMLYQNIINGYNVYICKSVQKAIVTYQTSVPFINSKIVIDINDCITQQPLSIYDELERILYGM